MGAQGGRCAAPGYVGTPRSKHIDVDDDEGRKMMESIQSEINPVSIMTRQLDRENNADMVVTKSLSRATVDKRMSRIPTVFLVSLIKKIEAASEESKMCQMDQVKQESLGRRLKRLGMESKRMEGDGNCQFRSIAFNLFGSQEHHAVSRKAAVAHMKKHSDFFSMFFDGPADFKAYLRDMARSRTWGDELTLRAVVEAYGCVMHVITSEPANWYLVYKPESTGDRDPTVARSPKGRVLPRIGKDVFLSYVSPIHYDAIVARPNLAKE